MNARILKSRRSKVITAAACGLALGLGTIAAAYWTGGGAGAGAATNKTAVSALMITQTASTGALAPGESVALSGTITNPNNTDVKVGDLTGSITGVSNGALATDFTLTGGPVHVNAISKKGTPATWSGLTLTYANSTVNQDLGKGATVSLSYSVTPFDEGPPALGTKTVTMENGVRTVTIRIDNIGGTLLVPGAQLSFWMGNGAPNGYLCVGTTSTYCNVTAPAPTTDIYGNVDYHGGTPVNSILPKVGADHVLYFHGPMTVAVQWQILNDGIIATL